MNKTPWLIPIGYKRVLYKSILLGLINNILANNNIIAFRENGNILIDDNGAVYFHREAVLGYISANELKGILSKNKIIY